MSDQSSQETIRSGVHRCNVCEKTFTRRHNLTDHMLLHAEVTPHTCNVCNKKFSHANNLKTHMANHSNNKPHQCDICMKTFVHPSYLQRHLLSHSDVKPFPCNKCDKSFTRSNGLTRHMKIHSGVKEHQCHVCKLAFRHEVSLRHHMWIHSDSREHQCSVCKETFKFANNLRKHMEALHPQAKPPCDNLNVCVEDKRSRSQPKEPAIVTVKQEVCDEEYGGDADTSFKSTVGVVKISDVENMNNDVKQLEYTTGNSTDGFDYSLIKRETNEENQPVSFVTNGPLCTNTLEGEILSHGPISPHSTAYAEVKIEKCETE